MVRCARCGRSRGIPEARLPALYRCRGAFWKERRARISGPLLHQVRTSTSKALQSFTARPEWPWANAFSCSAKESPREPSVASEPETDALGSRPEAAAPALGLWPGPRARAATIPDHRHSALPHHSAAQEPREGMERASFWRCARLLICISDADAAPQCSQLALRSLDAPAHWAIMTAAARRLVTTSAASNASVARVPAVPQSRRAPIRRTSCKPGRPKGPPTGRLPFSSTLGGRLSADGGRAPPAIESADAAARSWPCAGRCAA